MTRISRLLSALLLTGLSYPVKAVDWFAATPIEHRFYGYASLLYAYTEFDKETSDNAETTTGFGGQIYYDAFSQGYIYRPWVARFSALAHINSNSNQYSLQTLQEQSTHLAKIDLGLNLYERGDYPVMINLAKSRRFMDGQIDSTNDNQTISINSQIKDLIDNSQMNLAYTDSNETATLDERDYSGRTFNIDWTINRENTNWDVDVSMMDHTLLLNPENGTPLDNQEASDIFTLTHNWLPDSNQSVTSHYTFSKEKDEYLNTIRVLERQQLSSFALLRNDSDPRFRYNFNLLVDKTNNSSQTNENASSSERVNANANAGMSFDINEQWNFSTNLSVRNTEDTSFNDNSRNVDTTLTFLSSLSYSNDWQVTENTMYTMTFDNRMQKIALESRNEDETRYKSTLEHSLTWSQNFGNDSFALTLGQQLSDEVGDVDDDFSDSNNISHLLNLSWGNYTAEDTTYFQLTLDDTRHWDANPEEFQLANLQLSRRQNIVDTHGWVANLNAQYSRQITLEGEEIITNVVLGSMGYTNKQLFGIPNLFLRSDLVFPIDENSFDDGRRENQLTSWRTEIIYRLGLLEVKSDIILTDQSRYFRIEARRAFGF